jgi:hypothetical protein
MHADVQKVTEIVDPAQRAREASRVMDIFGKGVEELSRTRREAIDELLASGKTQAEVGALIGVSRARVSQLLRQGPAPERAFLGFDMLTVVVAGKVESGRPDPQPVVAQDDLVAYDRLSRLAKTVGLETTYEVVATGGFVRLNRDNLIVFCGPRHAPNVREVLESDESIGFEQDEKGWFLVDRRTGKTYRSGMDAGEPRDVAYMARLPRPDGKGTFLYAAGIHAVGENGAVHFLEHQLADMYRELKARRFSALIECEYDAASETREIVSSKLVTDYYRPAGA